MLTTAYLTLQLCLGKDVPVVVMPFDRILPAVAEGRVAAGLLIHEGQLFYKDRGLHKVVDLGAWWFEQTGLPLPLGGNVVRKDLGPEMVSRIARLLKESIRYALANRKEALDYALGYARGLDPALADRFVGMYVNEWTVDYGPRGTRGRSHLVRPRLEAGLVPGPISVEFTRLTLFAKDSTWPIPMALFRRSRSTTKPSVITGSMLSRRAGLPVSHLPFSLKILLENLLRYEDGVTVTRDDIKALASWDPKAEPDREIAFRPSRVLLQDFTGVPAIVDLAAMRDAMKRLGGDPKKINPLQPVELVIDHSVQVDSPARRRRSRLTRRRSSSATASVTRSCDGARRIREFPRRAAGHRHRAPGQPRIPGACRLLSRAEGSGAARWPIPTRWWAPIRTRR